jgi:hypothetical protein
MSLGLPQPYLGLQPFTSCNIRPTVAFVFDVFDLHGTRHEAGAHISSDGAE